VDAICVSDAAVSTVPKQMHPTVGANDRLDQAFVVRVFWRAIAFYGRSRVFLLGGPGNYNFLMRLVADRHRDQDPASSQNDALQQVNVIRCVSLLARCQGGKHGGFDLGGSAWLL
jgi:hypothetical protein